MNSHVVLKLGVAYKANLKHIVQVIIFSVVFSGIITVTNSAPQHSASLPAFNFTQFSFHPSKNNSRDIFPIVPGERTPPEQFLFLHASNNMWLEMLPNGRVGTNSCPTKYGALRTGSHSSKSLFKGDFNVRNGAAVYLQGVVSERYLCVTKDGQVYSRKDHHEKDCGFIQKPKFQKNNSHIHYFKHLYYNSTYERKNKAHKRRHKTVRFQLGFYSNGTVFVVQRHTQRRDDAKAMISINRSLRPMPEQTKCKVQLPKIKRRFKFCRRVWKTFFNASVKDLRRFRKYNCWDKLRRRRKLGRTQHSDDTG